MDTSTNNYIEDISPVLSSYQLCRSSGTLDFWDDSSEDIYTFEDGEPIDRV
jgi:hypothetical protein